MRRKIQEENDHSEEDVDEVEDEDEEEPIIQNLPWQKLPSIEEERDEQAQERMMKQASLELRLKTPINNTHSLIKKVKQIGWVDDKNSLISTDIKHFTNQSSDTKDDMWFVHQSVVSSNPTKTTIENIEDDLQRELAL